MAVNGIRRDLGQRPTTPDTTAPLFTTTIGADDKKKTRVETPTMMQVMADKPGVRDPGKIGPLVLPYGDVLSPFPKGMVPEKVYANLEAALKSAKLSPEKMNSLLQKVDPDLRDFPVARAGEGKLSNNFYDLDLRRGTVKVTDQGVRALMALRKKHHQPPIRHGDESDPVRQYLEQEAQEAKAGRDAVLEVSGLDPNMRFAPLTSRRRSYAQGSHSTPQVNQHRRHSDAPAIHAKPHSGDDPDAAKTKHRHRPAKRQG